MDKDLRELERKAQTDPQAALKLVYKLKRLIGENWQAMPCPRCSKVSYGPGHGCGFCDGRMFVRVNVSELKEFPGQTDKKKPKKKKTIQVSGAEVNELMKAIASILQGSILPGPLADGL